VAKTPIGKKVKITVLRQGKTKILKAEIKKMADEDLEKDKLKSSGKKVPSKASSYMLGMGLVDSDKNVIIVDIKAKSEAAKKGIQVGDVVLSANQTPIQSIAELKKIIDETKKSKRDGVFLFIKRENTIKSSDVVKHEEITFGVVLPIENDKKS
jgi:serine protease Do